MWIKARKSMLYLLIFAILAFGVLDYLYFTGKIDVPFDIPWLDRINMKVKDLVIPPAEYFSEGGVQLLVSSPDLTKQQQCGFKINGTITGVWFFEGSFPIDLVDDDGNLIVNAIAMTEEDWMTEEQVPFESLINCGSDCPSKGFLILTKNDPSDETNSSDTISIPVRFSQDCDTSEEEIINLFWGNIKIDPTVKNCDMTYPTTRNIVTDRDPKLVALELLFKGTLERERKRGNYTSLPKAVTVNELSVVNGVARVDFSKGLSSVEGGSCNVLMVRSQIENTLLQFPDVNEVIISIDGSVEVLQP